MNMLNYRTFPGVDDGGTLDAISGLVELCFGEKPGASFRERVVEKRRPLLVMAFEGETPVAFKLGYERSRDEFYSWLGAVHPGVRRRGIGAQILSLQHAWCRNEGYSQVTTETLNDNVAMLTLNLRAGFRVVGTRLDNRGLKVILELTLERHP